MRFPFISALVTLGEPSAEKCHSGEKRLSSEEKVDELLLTPWAGGTGEFCFQLQGRGGPCGSLKGSLKSVLWARLSLCMLPSISGQECVTD